MLRGFKRLKKVFLFVIVSSSVVILDFISKNIIETYVKSYEAIDLLPILRIVNVKNTGAAFGILTSLGNSTFIIISCFAILFIAFYIYKSTRMLEIMSLSLVIGGAIGNLIDRVRIGKVIDFIDFFVGTWHWPAFNIADSALTVGIVLFILSNLLQYKHQSKS
jgi:signal peptidase II